MTDAEPIRLDPIRLDPIEIRVLGSLLEKERTVPSTYPMTTNALVTSCNQRSGRDPVMTLTDDDVLAATERLKAARLVRLVHASHGARTVKHRQVVTERIELDDAERAVLTLLLLRGAQTPGELRSRAGRLHTFGDLAEVEGALDNLATRSDPFVVELDRRPGQKERRWAHLLGDGTASDDRDGPADVATVNPPAGNRSPGDAVLRDGADERDRRVAATYDAVAAAYASQLVDELDWKPFERWLLEQLVDLADGGPVADVGCGPGHIAFHLAAAGAAVTGFDRSPAMIAEARRRFAEVDVELGDLGDLRRPHAGDGWSVIVAWYSLVHLADAELAGAVASLGERLAPKGVLAVAVHAGPGLRHADSLYGCDVDVDFVLHDPVAVLDAYRAAGLDGIEWYRRSPVAGVEMDTERFYVVGRRPER